MKLRVSFLVLLYFAVFTASGQAVFKKGFLVRENGDTLRGYVHYITESKAYHVCEYRSEPLGSTTNYLPATITGYGFDNDRKFVSRSVTVTQSDTEIQQIVFLEVIVKGQASLYQYEEIYYAEKKTGGLLPLIEETSIQVNENGNYARRIKKYVGILTAMMSDCPAMPAKINAVSLREGQLINLFENYNACLGAVIQYSKKKESTTKIYFGVSAGAVLGSEHFIPYYNTPYNYRTTGPAAGVSAEFVSPHFNERFSLYTEISYRRKPYPSSVIKTGSSGINLNSFQLPIGVRYTLNRYEIQPYVNAGFMFNMAFGSYDKSIIEVLPIQAGLWGGAGIIFPLSEKLKGFLDCRVSNLHSNLIDSYEGIIQTVINVQLTAGIRFRSHKEK